MNVRLLILGLSALMLVPVLSGGAVLNPENGHTYEYISAPPQIAWMQARDSAESLGGYLVSITSQSEQDFVLGLIPDGDSAWLGGMDAVFEGRWIWWSGQSFTYQNWSVDEPDTFEGRDYIAMHEADGGGWRASFGFGDAFIVEWNCCDGELAGNANCDPSGAINIFDVTFLVSYLYKGGAAPCCLDRGNVNGDQAGLVNIMDITSLISFLYKGGGPLPPCGPTPGHVWTTDTIFAVDSQDKAWDITHAVLFYGMDPDSMNFGIGQYTFPPVLNPQFYSPGDPEYPGPDENFQVLGVRSNDDRRAYRLQTLIGHEVVDDLLDGQYIAATY